MRSGDDDVGGGAEEFADRAAAYPGDDGFLFLPGDVTLNVHMGGEGGAVGVGAVQACLDYHTVIGQGLLVQQHTGGDVDAGGKGGDKNVRGPLVKAASSVSKGGIGGEKVDAVGQLSDIGFLFAEMWNEEDTLPLLVDCKLVQLLWKSLWRFLRKLRIDTT